MMPPRWFCWSWSKSKASTTAVARYKLILAYDGTNFLGFQRQRRKMAPLPGRTVQGVLEETLQKLGWQGETILAAGRTDRGVHASGQVVAFDLEWAHSLEELQKQYSAHIAIESGPLKTYATAEEYHQKYLDKNPGGYCHIPIDAFKDAAAARPQPRDFEAAK